MSRPGGLDLGGGRPPRGGALLIALGAVLLMAGLVIGGYGIVRAVQSNAAIEDDAVATGVVSAVPGEPVRFESDADELSVYLDFDGVTDNSVVQERASGAVGCLVSGQDGSSESFSGARQGTAATVGDYVSVGSFSIPSGEISCVYTSASSALPGEVPYVVTLGGTGAAAWPVFIIIGGVTVALLGGWAAVGGWLRRRRAARLRAL